MNKESVSIVIPSYQDRQRLIPTLHALTSLTTSESICRDLETEFIVVEDGRWRANAPHIESQWTETVESVPNLRLITTEHRGKGHAVKRGVYAADGRLILTLDADAAMAIPPEETLERKIKFYIDHYEKSYPDILVGKRPSPRRRKRMSFLRKWLAQGSRITINALGLGDLDPTHPMKLYKSEVVKELFTRVTIDGFAFDIEILYLARKEGKTVESIESQWLYTSGSTYNILRDFPKMVFYSLSLPLRHK